jgi:hypothetical protein
VAHSGLLAHRIGSTLSAPSACLPVGKQALGIKKRNPLSLARATHAGAGVGAVVALSVRLAATTVAPVAVVAMTPWTGAVVRAVVAVSVRMLASAAAVSTRSVGHRVSPFLGRVWNTLLEVRTST